MTLFWPLAPPLDMLAPPFQDWPAVPYVGVGCLVLREEGLLLLVRDHRGCGSPPGGHLEFGESLEACAARETAEETGLVVTGLAFLAVTNDVPSASGRHYVTVWMRGVATSGTLTIGDPAEVAEAGWFPLDALPAPRPLYFENLLAGRCLPPGQNPLSFSASW